MVLTWRWVYALSIFTGLLVVTPVQAQDFYTGKTIRIVEGRAPGGTGALRVNAMVPFLQKYLPGNPNFVAEFMQGGGGRKAANYIYNNAKPDGLTVGNVGSGLVANAILGAPGVKYDIDKFIMLGAPNGTAQYAFITPAKLGIDSLDKLLARPGLRVGAQSVGHDIYIQGRIFSWILGLKEPKFITGYSGPEVDIAMFRGELDARTGTVGTFLTRSPEFVEKKVVNFHAVLNIPRAEKNPHPLFTKMTELDTFVKSERERKVLRLVRAIRMTGSPFIFPPNTPKEAIDTLAEAMRKTFQDPEFHKEYLKLSGDAPTPILADAHAQAIKELPRDEETISTFKLLAGNQPLPSR